MNINFSSILLGSKRILHIVNKVLPLIKDVKPTLNSLLNNNNSSQKSNSVKEIHYIDKKEIDKKKEEIHNNSLTFFN